MASFSLPTVLAAAAFSLVVGALASGPATVNADSAVQTRRSAITIRFDSDHGFKIERSGADEDSGVADQDSKIVVIEASALGRTWTAS